MADGYINGQYINIIGPYTYGKDLGVSKDIYKDSDGNWYFGTHAASGQNRYISLIAITDEQLSKLERLGLTKHTWGGKREGAGAPKKHPEDAKRRQIPLTDDEYTRVLDFIQQLRSEHE